jgi:hypothetical protein
LSSSSWIERKAFDCFGRELEAHECEYCGQLKPVKLWNGIDGCSETFKILMVEYLGYNERKMWRCTECATDIANRLVI